MDIDGSELLALVDYFEDAKREVAEKTYTLVKQHAQELRDEWRENAKLTARSHGKHYPKAITTEQIPRADMIEWTVGPETRRKQGDMGPGFEYGSRNQPPHLDGARAAIKREPLFLKGLDDIIRGLL
ncbi:hypothetical protein [Streptosporangium vulgare]|uniref:HK97 gp10 family phage protein n=1 Tax=Streptosporangium vulgare TaxID=46190 RepID=A0ABV5TSZ1_9ACTN